MITVQSTLEIRCPVEQVFLYAGDYRNDIFWRKGVILMECDPSGMLHVGTVTRETMFAFGKHAMTIARVTEYEPCRRTAFESLDGPVPCTGFRSFESTPNGTRFTYSLNLRPRGWHLLMLPVLYFVFSRQVKQDVYRLRHILEREHASRRLETESAAVGDTGTAEE